jgi:hypothetical protein
MQTMAFGVPGSLGEQGGFEIKLSAESLLRFSGWNQGHREYIRSFDGGPPLRSIVQLYGQEMIELYRWLLVQYPLLHPPGVPPPHLYQ